MQKKTSKMQKKIRILMKQDLTGRPAVTQKKVTHRISQNLIKGDSNERYDEKNHPCKISAKSAHYGRRYWPFSVLDYFEVLNFPYWISQESVKIEQKFLYQNKAYFMEFQGLGKFFQIG